MVEGRDTSRRYVVTVLVTLGVGLSFTLLNAAILSDDALIRCDASRLNASNYVAACNGYFGDYEHAALYFGLERDAIASLKQAQVVILGNSRAMWAFSTSATDVAFRSIRTRYYVLGFGAAERMRFPSAIIRKYDLRPRAVIVNADPFFVDATDPPYESILGGRIESRLPNLARKHAQRWLGAFCADPPRWFPFRRCDRPVILRSVMDGRWDIRQYAQRQQRYSIAVNPNRSLDRSEELIRGARGLLDLLHIPSECLIITSVPSNLQTPRAAQRVAVAIRATYIEPQLDGLNTIDADHLSPESAEKWSAAMLALAAQRLKGCIT